MTVTHAHFDGKVFVPDRPVDLQPGRVTLHVIPADSATHPLTGLPVLRLPTDAKTISDDDVRRAMDEG